MASIASSGYSQEAGASTGTPVSFTSTLAAEWSKLTTLRATWITLALALVLSTGTTALLSWAIGWSWSDWGEADRAAFEPFTYSLTGLLFGGILFVVLGVNAVAPEYASGMMRQTLTTTPRRGRVFAAKLVVVSIVSILGSAVVITATILTGQAVFAAYDVPTVSVTDGDAAAALVLMFVTAPVFPLIGVAAAFLLRSAAAAITLVIAVMFIPSMFGGLFPRRWQEDVLAWLPGPLTDSVSMAPLDVTGAMYKDPWVAALALVAWMVAILGFTLVMLNRRDV